MLFAQLSMCASLFVRSNPQPSWWIAATGSPSRPLVAWPPNTPPRSVSTASRTARVEIVAARLDRWGMSCSTRRLWRGQTQLRLNSDGGDRAASCGHSDVLPLNLLSFTTSSCKEKQPYDAYALAPELLLAYWWARVSSSGELFAVLCGKCCNATPR